MTRLVFLLGILAGLALALYAGCRVHRWRDAQEEQRLRKADEFLSPPSRGAAGASTHGDG
jgi:hypothetical protein